MPNGSGSLALSFPLPIPSVTRKLFIRLAPVFVQTCQLFVERFQFDLSMDCPRFQRWARVCLNVFVEGDPHRFDRDQSKAKPGGGEKEGANPASLRGILAVVGGGCIQRAEELGQPSPSCENLFLKVHMIGGSHDQVGRC